MFRLAAALCAALLVCFGGLSFAAIRTKSATFDEPMHAVSAWIHLHRADYRISYEDPPLWHYWAALPNNANALRADSSGPLWTSISSDLDREWPYTYRTLYETPENDAASFIHRSRLMMLALGVLVGVLIALWAWQLAGPWAGVVALFFFALDPNFLGHAPLIKGDTVCTLVTLGLTFATWRMGRRVTLGNALAAALLCGAALTTKFSAMVFCPVMALLLTVRALLPEPWMVLGRSLSRRAAKLGAAGALLAVMVLASFGVLWASYGFRFAATPDGSSINFDRRVEELRLQQVAVRHPSQPPTAEEFAAWQPDHFTRTLVWAHDHHLVPEAWTAGLLYVRARSLLRESFLVGEKRLTGWWYYFPSAMAFKTPVATLLGALAMCLVALALRRTVTRDGSWTVLCLALPPAAYLASIMSSNLNIGIRHALPVYPFLFIGLGWAACEALKRWRRGAIAVLASLMVGLGVESAHAFPNDIAFFNAAAGGSRAGLGLLGDSNLDWGQDLPLLAQWQKQHPEKPLYLGYFGMAEPASYGIQYKMLPGNPINPRPPDELKRPAVLAVSATKLQGLQLPNEWQPFYQMLRDMQPTEVLGGTIYLYDLP